MADITRRLWPQFPLGLPIIQIFFVMIMEEKNIFEIWKENGEKTPFAVRRRNWANQYYTIVTGVVIKKWPYGDAYGYATINGTFSNHYEYDKRWRESGIIPCCGCYQWTLVENPHICQEDYQRFKMQFFSRKKQSILKKPVLKKPEDTYQITYELLQKDHSVEEIAKERSVTTGTIYSHIGKLISQKFPINLDKFVPKEKQIQIIYVAQLLNQDKLKPLKDHLGDDFSYDEIRLTLIARANVVMKS